MTGKKPMGKQYTQKVLIVIQLIISIFFISVTFIMYRQLHFMHTKDLGFDYKNVFIINPQTEDMKEFILNVDKISEELSQHPSISGVLKQTYNFFDVHGGMRTSTHWADKVRERDYDTWISII